MLIDKPKIEDLTMIRNILEQWTEPDEVEKYLSRIESEINGHTEYSMNFFVVKDQELVIGVGGLARPLPLILPLAKTDNPGEMKILYIDDKHRSKGIGKQMIHFLEQEAKSRGYEELFVRSAEKYKNTAYGFYEKIGYKQIVKLENNMSVFHKII